MTQTPAATPDTRSGNAPFVADDVAALDARLRELARVPVLFVATDYDGTLSPIVDRPEDARPDREAMVAVRALAKLPNTHVAVVSGRSLRDLAALTGEPDGVHLVGSHGSEFDLDFAANLEPEAAELRTQIQEQLEAIAADHPGCTTEAKPASVAFHYRNAEPNVGEAARKVVESGPGALDGVYPKLGKKVIELAVVSTNKGEAISTVRRRVGASAAVFLGDDVTDEDAFGILTGPDLGIKVGFEGETQASFRVEGTTDVARILARLCELRASWLEGSEAVPIQHHSMLTDQRTVALLTPDARVTWMCVPRIDSHALFAELLGGPMAGYFAIRPAAGGEPTGQVYLGDTFHVRTTWPKLTVTDYLDCSGGRVAQRPGRSDLVRVISGVGRVRIEFAPRPDFGRTAARLSIRDEGVVIEDTVDPIVLRGPDLPWRIEEEGGHEMAIAEFDLAAGDGPVVLELRCGTGSLRESVITEPKRSRQTERYWSTWASNLDLPKLQRDLLRRSALVLRGLAQGPTGAIAAAATTSLPESIGGIRNWDYRYCWPRDAAMSASALVRLGSTDEALRLLDWLLGVVDDLPSPERLSPLYTVSGGEIPPEAEISELAGYAGSRPVRIGNAASRQLQLDVFGPIVELVHLLLMSGAPLGPEHWRLVEAMVSAVDARWREPDHGIWEIRGPRRHHVHSKVMCWQTAALGVEIAERFMGRSRPAWEALRDEIAADVIANGWKEGPDAFTISYESDEADAAALFVGLAGMIAPDDPRFASTVEAVIRELREGDTVYRYHGDDGLPGKEGGFNICTTWLIESLALIGRCDDARQLFDAYCTCAGPTGLLAEEHDPQQNLALGNHPQAYSHLGLINAALRLENGC